MRVPEEWVIAIRLVSKGHFVPQLILLIITHVRQCPSVLFVQAIVVPPQNEDHETESPKCCDDTNLAGDVARCLLAWNAS